MVSSLYSLGISNFLETWREGSMKDRIWNLGSEQQLEHVKGGEFPRTWETGVEGHSFLLGFRERVKATVRKPDHVGSRWHDTLACAFVSSCVASTGLPGSAREVGSNLHLHSTAENIAQWWTPWLQSQTAWVLSSEFSSSIYQLFDIRQIT